MICRKTEFLPARCVTLLCVYTLTPPHAAPMLFWVLIAAAYSRGPQTLSSGRFTHELVSTSVDKASFSLFRWNRIEPNKVQLKKNFKKKKKMKTKTRNQCDSHTKFTSGEPDEGAGQEGIWKDRAWFWPSVPETWEPDVDLEILLCLWYYFIFNICPGDWWWKRV